MSKERTKRRAERERTRSAEAGKDQPVKTAPKPAAKPPKKSGPRTPAGNKRKNAPIGRADGPLARRRRLRVRLLLGLLLVVNIAAAVIWRDWKISLAVFIVSVITAPLLAALLLRRRK